MFICKLLVTLKQCENTFLFLSIFLLFAWTVMCTTRSVIVVQIHCLGLNLNAKKMFTYSLTRSYLYKIKNDLNSLKFSWLYEVFKQRFDIYIVQLDCHKMWYNIIKTIINRGVCYCSRLSYRYMYKLLQHISWEMRCIRISIPWTVI